MREGNTLDKVRVVKDKLTQVYGAYSEELDGMTYEELKEELDSFEDNIGNQCESYPNEDQFDGSHLYD